MDPKRWVMAAEFVPQKHQEDKLKEDIAKSCGVCLEAVMEKNCHFKDGLEFCQAAITHFAWSAFGNGGSRTNSKKKQGWRARYVEQNRTLFVPVRTGWTLKTRRTNWWHYTKTV